MISINLKLRCTAMSNIPNVKVIKKLKNKKKTTKKLN